LRKKEREKQTAVRIIVPEKVHLYWYEINRQFVIQQEKIVYNSLLKKINPTLESRELSE